MKNQSHKVLKFAILFFILTTVIAIRPIGGIHAQQPISIKIDQLFSDSQVIFPFAKNDKIYRLAINGSIHLYQDNSLIRVILVGDDLREYLVYEAYPLIVDNNSVEITNECEETCIMEAIAPHSLKIELIDASLKIDQIALSDYPPSFGLDPANAQILVKGQRDADRIIKLNENIKKKGLKWAAGETSVSRLFYEEKKKLFGRDRVPNLQGFEFYKGGVFEIKSEGNSSSFSDNGGSSVIESFDWRNRHSADDPASPYYDGDPTGSGWITAVKSQGCNHCWAFAPVHATEAIVNLYFNQHLDLDLSEQDVAACSGGNIGCCQGGYSSTVLDYIVNTGVVDESCFPYSASCESCSNKCNNPNDQITISGKTWVTKTEEEIKRAIIDYGPIAGGISSWWHFMVMVGFDKDNDTGDTIWTFKNSWGTGWGDNGYGYIKVPLNDLYGLMRLETPVTSLITPFDIACNDFDGDGYYNWGIAEDKPPSCPASALPDKDCDDSNPYLGPFNNDGSCKEFLVFEDVPPGYWAYDYITAIYDAGITKGCSQNPLRYCPQNDVTRAQMAAFLVRAVEGEPDDNLCSTGSPFADVPSGHWACKYIKRLLALEITTGCGGGNYCPNDTVTRAQMAAFIIRAVEGEPDDNLCATGSLFSDVPSGHWACKYIKRLSELGITTGCGGNNYCPSDNVTRAQMAAFLARAFLDMD